MLPLHVSRPSNHIPHLTHGNNPEPTPSRDSLPSTHLNTFPHPTFPTTNRLPSCTPTILTHHLRILPSPVLPTPQPPFVHLNSVHVCRLVFRFALPYKKKKKINMSLSCACLFPYIPHPTYHIPSCVLRATQKAFVLCSAPSEFSLASPWKHQHNPKLPLRNQLNALSRIPQSMQHA